MTRSKSSRLAGTLFTAIVMSANTALAQPTYSVIGVQADDTLNVRTDIDRVDTVTEAHVAGALPHDASGIQTSGITYERSDGAVWREIRQGDLTGWVNERYLQRDHQEPWFPSDLQCSGTEPFWSFDMSAMTAEFDDMGGKLATFEQIGILPGQNRRDVFETLWLPTEGLSVVTAVLQDTQSCSDGMSDHLSDIEIVLLGIRKDEGPVVGCCSFSMN
jgi:uncharacterized membrane protein